MNEQWFHLGEIMQAAFGQLFYFCQLVERT